MTSNDKLRITTITSFGARTAEQIKGLLEKHGNSLQPAERASLEEDLRFLSVQTPVSEGVMKNMAEGRKTSTLLLNMRSAQDEPQDEPQDEGKK
ncbi:uncharacterized protein DFE_A0022 (plasmid) [Desulfovibrio ferrophilus]|uniref:Uncharacterized protein n=1 Tax=Desulfovibrio ferrophilus TaxID=241368 RepID=A0A2Z6B3X1_9BACT|nr:uncharacterized protein DFE_A0022 [Desulfovibrio ferrophilus]